MWFILAWNVILASDLLWCGYSEKFNQKRAFGLFPSVLDESESRRAFGTHDTHVIQPCDCYKRLQICSDELSSFRFKGVWGFFFSRNRILWFQSSSKDSLTRERVCDVRSVSDTHFAEHSSLEKRTVDMIYDKDLKSWPFRYVTEKKFNVCMCVCPVYMCVCPPLSMWMTLSSRDFAPYLLIGWLCRIAIADFAPYLLIFCSLLWKQTRASFFYHFSCSLESIRHELSSFIINWDLQTRAFLFCS